MIRISHMFSIVFFLAVFKSISFVTLCLFLSSIQFLSYFSSFPVSFFHSVYFFLPFLFLFPVLLLPFFSFCFLSFSFPIPSYHKCCSPTSRFQGFSLEGGRGGKSPGSEVGYSLLKLLTLPLWNIQLGEGFVQKTSMF